MGLLGRDDRASRSASSWQCTCPFYSSCAGFFGKASHHPGLSAPHSPDLAPCDFWLFPHLKLPFEREEICWCDRHTGHKLNQRRLTADWLAPRESHWSLMHNKVSSDWLPSYFKATRPVLEIFKMTWYFPDSPRTVCSVWVSVCAFHNGLTVAAFWKQAKRLTIQKYNFPVVLYGRGTLSHREKEICW
jgi:hypothetical protein